MKSKSLGAFGELQAALYLQKRGYKILQKNFRCPLGEIDLVVVKNNQISFIEVKTRSGCLYGYPYEAVGKIKLHQIEKTILYFLNKYPKMNKKIAVGVVSILISSGEKSFDVEFLPDVYA